MALRPLFSLPLAGGGPGWRSWQEVERAKGVKRIPVFFFTSFPRKRESKSH